MCHTGFTSFLFLAFKQCQSALLSFRSLLFLLPVFILTGCADISGTRPSTHSASANALLSPWRSIESAIQEPGSATTAPGGYIQLGRPVSVAAWADYVYIADTGRQAILRYDLRRETFSIYYRMRITSATRIIATAGEYLYISDPLQSRILYLDRNARLIREIKDFNLKQPVAIAEDFSRGQILVADAFYNQVLVFNKLGRLINVLHPVDETSAPIAGLTAMLIKGRQMYFLDRLQPRVVVTDLEGQYLYSLARNSLKQPVAMRIDDIGRLIVADAFDNSLLFFSDDRMHKTTAITEPVMTMQLADMDLHENWLYLADVAAARIQIMKLHYPVAASAEKK